LRDTRQTINSKCLVIRESIRFGMWAKGKTSLNFMEKISNIINYLLF